MTHLLFILGFIMGQLGRIELGSGISFYIHDLIIFGLIVLHFIHLPPGNWGTRPTLAKPLTYFIGACILSLLVQIPFVPISQILSSGLYIVRFVLYAQLYMVLVLSISHTKFEYRKWQMALWVSGLIILGLGFIQYTLYPSLRNLLYLGWDPHDYRLFSTLFDPNFVGLLFVFTMILTIALYERRHISGRTSFVSLLALCLGIILTFSRSSILTGLTAVIVYFFGRISWKKTLPLAILFLFFVWILPKPAGDSLRFTRIDSVLSRVGNWNYALTLFTSNPITGVGFSTLRYRLEQAGQEGATRSHAAGGIENSFLFVLATTGAIGMSAYVYFWYRLFCLKTHKDYRSLWYATLSAVGIHSMFLNSAFYPWVLIWVFVLASSMEDSTSKS